MFTFHSWIIWWGWKYNGWSKYSSEIGLFQWRGNQRRRNRPWQVSSSNWLVGKYKLCDSSSRHLEETIHIPWIIDAFIVGKCLHDPLLVWFSIGIIDFCRCEIEGESLGGEAGPTHSIVNIPSTSFNSFLHKIILKIKEEKYLPFTFWLRGGD